MVPLEHALCKKQAFLAFGCIMAVFRQQRPFMESSGWKPQRLRWGGKLARRRRELCTAEWDD